MASVERPATGELVKEEAKDATPVDPALLQLRYMDLLEKRIAQLEKQVESTAKQLDDQSKKEESEKEGDKKDGKEEDKDTKTYKRYRSTRRQWNTKTEAFEDSELDSKKTAQDDDKREVAFTFRRVYLDTQRESDDETSRSYSEVDIEAKDLKSLLKRFIGSDYPGQSMEGDKVNMVAPFHAIIHNWDKLAEISEKATEESNEPQVNKDLHKLLEYIQGAPELDNYFKTRETNRKANLITYQTLWTLWSKGTLFVAQPFLGEEQCFELFDYQIPDRTEKVDRHYYLWGWCWEYNGTKYIKVVYVFTIERFKGTKDINKLDYYPIQYHKDAAGLKKRLVERGAKYDKIVRSKVGCQQMWAYKGDAIFDKDPLIKRQRNNDDDSDDDRRRIRSREPLRQSRTIQGPVLVDPEAYNQFAPSYFPLGDLNPVTYIDKDKPKADEDEEDPITEEEKAERASIVRPPRLLGYSTKEKRWGQYAVKSTDEAARKDPKAFKESLELNDKYKSMIEALVEQHQGPLDDSKDAAPSDKHQRQVQDFVADKGKGLVLLLHGPPGVGKTLTAETIARATGKPLFIVSVAEIGLNASKAERNLEQLFYLAGRWESVLLVDEADVFLESRRESSEPNRNALVSVLLRVLEYYHGIMILTTNRITSLDIAVQSRIHLAIRYEDLDKEQKKRIFRTFLGQLKPGDIDDYDGVIDFIDRYGWKDKLNGREIRNVVSSALSLARSEARQGRGNGKLTKEHLSDVMEITAEFQLQLDDITRSARADNEVKKTRR